MRSLPPRPQITSRWDVPVSRSEPDVPTIVQRTPVDVVAALAGLGVAIWHNYLILFPPASMSCGRPFEWFNEDFPLIVWLPKIFRGDGDCLAVDWTLLGLSIPQWSVVVFVALLALLVVAFRRARAAEPPPTIGL